MDAEMLRVMCDGCQSRLRTIQERLDRAEEGLMQKERERICLSRGEHELENHGNCGAKNCKHCGYVTYKAV